MIDIPGSAPMPKLALGRKKSKKKLVIIASSVTILLAGLAGGFWWYHSTTSQTYHQAFSVQNTKAADALAKAETAFKQLKETPNNATALQVLQDLQTQLKQAVDGLPAPPTLLSMPILPAADLQKQANLQKAVADLKTDLAASAELLTYQNQVLEILKITEGKRGSNSAEQKTLADTWQTVIAKLQEITPPARVAQVHSQLIATVQSIQATLATLPALFDKKDTAGFAAKKTELQSKMSGLHSTADILVTLATETDHSITAHLATLKALLK